MQFAVPNFATGFNNFIPPPQNAFLSAFQQPAIIPLKPQPKLIPQQAMPQNPPMQQQMLQNPQLQPKMMQNPQFQQALQTYQNVLNQQQIMRGMDTLLQHLLYQSSRTLQISPLLLPPFINPSYPNTMHILVQQAPQAFKNPPVYQGPQMQQAPQVFKGPLVQQAPIRVQQNQQAGFQAQQNDRKV